MVRVWRLLMLVLGPCQMRYQAERNILVPPRRRGDSPCMSKLPEINKFELNRSVNIRDLFAETGQSDKQTNRQTDRQTNKQNDESYRPPYQRGLNRKIRYRRNKVPSVRNSLLPFYTLYALGKKCYGSRSSCSCKSFIHNVMVKCFYDILKPWYKGWFDMHIS